MKNSKKSRLALKIKAVNVLTDLGEVKGKERSGSMWSEWSHCNCTEKEASACWQCDIDVYK